MTQAHTQTAVAAALTAAGLANPAVLSNTEASLRLRELRFDPIAYFEEIVTETELRKPALTSAAWALDTEIVNVGRDLYFQIREENPECKDIGSLIDAFKGTYSNESYWGEGPTKLLTQLVYIQDAWYASATRAAMATGWLDYAPKSIDELILGTKPMPIKASAVTNLTALADYAARSTGGKITKEEMLDVTLKGVATKNEQRAEFARSLAPAIRVFIEQARHFAPALPDNYDDHAPAIEFTDLPEQTRLSILSKIKMANVRARSDLAMRLDPVQFLLVMAESVNADTIMAGAIDRLTREVERQRM